MNVARVSLLWRWKLRGRSAAELAIPKEELRQRTSLRGLGPYAGEVVSHAGSLWRCSSVRVESKRCESE